MKNLAGLTTPEALQRLAKFGRNELIEINKISPLRILLRQIRKNFVIYLLVIAALISLFVGKTETGYIILLVVALVIFTGFIQEYRAEKSIQALKQMIMPVAIVRRNGKEQEIQATELVPDDIVILRNGEKIPADCVILQQNELRVNESILTGESTEIKKTITKTEEVLDDNKLFMGTYIVNGKCVAQITHTGMNTRFGKIAGMISTAEKQLPLQDKINSISRYMVVVAIVVSTLTGIVMTLRAPELNYEVLTNILILVIALSVSAFPEGLPVVLITTLAVGANRMSKQNAIVNRMSIIETLGETTVVCSDKTGTLTKGEMTVKKIYADNSLFDVTGIGFEAKGDVILNGNKVAISKNIPLHYLITSSVLCNDSQISRIGDDAVYKITGSATEGALLILGAKLSIFKEDFRDERTEEIPFSSSRKIMSVAYKEKHEHVVHAKGAPEVVLSKCTHIQLGNERILLTEEEKKKILHINNTLTSEANRVLAVAYKIDINNADQYTEDKLVFLGLVAMEDPPREEVKSAIASCATAGIKVIMITGDNKETAQAIGKEIGIIGNTMEGSTIDSLTDDELSKLASDIAIFARVKPEHKLRIVRALKNNGEIVTMTGDGVNDAPSLKEAHIGVAMGKNGTDVTRSVADITLKDDNFATIVSAIKEGRGVFNNIRKFVTYDLSCNLAELSILFFGVLLAPFLHWQTPLLLALHILFMNLITDNLPAISLGFNPTSPDIMKEMPRKKAQILPIEFIRVLLFNGFIMALATLTTYFIMFNLLHYSSEVSRTAALVTLILVEIASAFNFRSFRFGVLNKGIFINKYLVYASLVSVLATLLIVYTPAKVFFETKSLHISAWLIAIYMSILIIVLFDLLKKINNRNHKLIPHTT